jgi:hypothetical protein
VEVRSRRAPRGCLDRGQAIQSGSRRPPRGAGAVAGERREPPTDGLQLVDADGDVAAPGRSRPTCPSDRQDPRVRARTASATRSSARSVRAGSSCRQSGAEETASQPPVEPGGRRGATTKLVGAAARLVG